MDKRPTPNKKPPTSTTRSRRKSKSSKRKKKYKQIHKKFKRRKNKNHNNDIKKVKKAQIPKRVCIDLTRKSPSPPSPPSPPSKAQKLNFKIKQILTTSEYRTFVKTIKTYLKKSKNIQQFEQNIMKPFAKLFGDEKRFYLLPLLIIIIPRVYHPYYEQRLQQIKNELSKLYNNEPFIINGIELERLSSIDRFRLMSKLTAYNNHNFRDISVPVQDLLSTYAPIDVKQLQYFGMSAIRINKYGDKIINIIKECLHEYNIITPFLRQNVTISCNRNIIDKHESECEKRGVIITKRDCDEKSRTKQSFPDAPSLPPLPSLEQDDNIINNNTNNTNNKKRLRETSGNTNSNPSPPRKKRKQIITNETHINNDGGISEDWNELLVIVKQFYTKKVQEIGKYKQEIQEIKIKHEKELQLKQKEQNKTIQRILKDFQDKYKEENKQLSTNINKYRQQREKDKTIIKQLKLKLNQVKQSKTMLVDSVHQQIAKIDDENVECDENILDKIVDNELIDVESISLGKFGFDKVENELEMNKLCKFIVDCCPSLKNIKFMVDAEITNDNDYCFDFLNDCFDRIESLKTNRFCGFATNKMNKMNKWNVLKELEISWKHFKQYIGVNCEYDKLKVLKVNVENENKNMNMNERVINFLQCIITNKGAMKELKYVGLFQEKVDEKIEKLERNKNESKKIVQLLTTLSSSENNGFGNVNVIELNNVLLEGGNNGIQYLEFWFGEIITKSKGELLHLKCIMNK